jgi:hypothetical protein
MCCVFAPGFDHTRLDPCFECEVILSFQKAIPNVQKNPVILPGFFVSRNVFFSQGISFYGKWKDGMDGITGMEGILGMEGIGWLNVGWVNVELEKVFQLFIYCWLFRLFMYC